MQPQESDAARILDGQRVRLERVNDEIELGHGAVQRLRTERALAANIAQREGLIPMLQGAALRNDNTELSKAQRQIAKLVQENARLQAALAEALESSNRDGLTGVLGRRGFDHLLEKEWARSRRAETPLGLLFVDVDRFKVVNDKHGHLAGDAALRAIAEAIDVQARRSGETLARYGGDEFVVILPGTPLEGALAVGERIRASVAELRLRVDDEDIPLSVSIGGAAVVPHLRTKADSLIDLADKAVFQAKEAGRGVCVGAAYEDGSIAYYRPAPRVEPDGTGRVTEISSKARRTR
jgi:diguanylate cyclase (GGDEF)-like protein